MAYKDIIKRREADLRWYYKNKDKRRLYKSRARKLRIEYIGHLKEVPCKDCGLSFPSFVMDFDHYKPGTKVETINKLANNNVSWSNLLKEIQKCEVVCANCHRSRTYKRRQLSIIKY